MPGPSGQTACCCTRSVDFGRCRQLLSLRQSIPPPNLMTRRNYFIRIFQKTFPQSPLVLEKPFPSVFFCQLQQLGLKNAIKGGSGLLPESESLVEGVMRKQPGGGTVGFEGCYTPRGEGSLKAAALQPKQGPRFCCELPAEKAGAAAAGAEQWDKAAELQRDQCPSVSCLSALYLCQHQPPWSVPGQTAPCFGQRARSGLVSVKMLCLINLVTLLIIPRCFPVPSSPGSCGAGSGDAGMVAQG